MLHAVSSFAWIVCRKIPGKNRSVYIDKTVRSQVIYLKTCRLRLEIKKVLSTFPAAKPSLIIEVFTEQQTQDFI